MKHALFAFTALLWPAAACAQDASLCNSPFALVPVLGSACGETDFSRALDDALEEEFGEVRPLIGMLSGAHKSLAGATLGAATNADAVEIEHLDEVYEPLRTGHLDQGGVGVSAQDPCELDTATIECRIFQIERRLTIKYGEAE